MSGTYKSIGDGVFVNCTNLETLTISEGMVSTGKSMFGRCEKLNNVTLPNSIKSIENATFEACSSLETIKLPNNWKFCIFILPKFKRNNNSRNSKDNWRKCF